MNRLGLVIPLTIKGRDMDSIPKCRTSAERDTKLPIGTNRCRCSSCKEYFGGVRAFEIHRVGPPEERTCLSRSGMREAGLSQDANGYWSRSYGEAAA